MAAPLALSDIEAAIAPHGLAVRGGFKPGPEDGVPALADGSAPAAVVMIGNVGSAMWRAFDAAGPHAGSDPLNAWSEAVISRIATELGAASLFPFTGPPYLSFQRWAQKAEAVYPSPLGVLIHPEYGLWHAYRGALAFAQAMDFGPRDDRPSPCETCADKPCLGACPVDAFDGTAYDVDTCIGHLSAPSGEECASHGCLARRACPVGHTYRYEPEQIRFHMRAFIAAHT